MLGGPLVAREAYASVSIAIEYDALVSGADAIAVVTPTEAKSMWENGRIYTYTRVSVEQGVAGALTPGSEGWIRTMGGVVGDIGQLVEGEAVFVPGKSSMVFLHKQNKPSQQNEPASGGTWTVTARAQGQYSVVVDNATKVRKVMRSRSMGAILLPNGPKAQTQSAPARLAGNVLHERVLDDATHELALAWKRLHPQPR
jgi:hypothetical protein